MVMKSNAPVVVLGAGIIGLNVAWELAKRGHGKNVVVVAEYHPGDQSINYASPWAGADFSAVSGSDTNALRWDRQSYPILLKMADNPKQPYVKRTPSYDYYEEAPSKEKVASMAEYLEDFRILDQSELLEGTTFGISFTAVTIFAPTHCKHLKSLLTQEYGVRFERKRLPSLSSAFELYPSAKIVFNCVGGAAETFPGVKDTKCFPTRGQILIAHAPKVSCCMARHGRDYGTYVIPRPNSGGQVVLGGYQQKHISTGDTFGGETDSIRERTGRLLPALLDDDVHIMAQLAGLRPSREGGARVEREEVGSGRAVIHNYGAGGTGYQAGIAMSIDAVNLADSDLTSKR